MGICELGQEYVLKKKKEKPGRELRKERRWGLLVFRWQWETNDKTKGKGGRKRGVR